MKKLFVIIAILFASNLSFGQVHWIMNPDTIPNCEMIKSGKFINKVTNEIATEGYYIIFEDGYATEYINNGEYYLKSKIEFLSDCVYKSTVIEITIPESTVTVGTIIFTEIISTSSVDNLLEIKSTTAEESYYFVLQKIAD